MKYSGPNLITDLATEPITLDEAKLWLKLDTSPVTAHPDDALITALITAARKAIENEINRPLGEQTFEIGFPCFQSAFEFPRPPLRSIVSIKYTLDDGTVQTVEDQGASPAIPSTVDYDLETSADPGAIYIRSGEAWPADTLANGFPVRIRYTAGLVPVPSPLIQAMRWLIGHLYENRQQVTLQVGLVQGAELPLALKYFCAPYKYEVFG